MFSRAKEVIIDCAKKNENGYPGYSSLSASIQFHLKKLVGDVYWMKAEEIMRNYTIHQSIKFGSMSVADATISAKDLARLGASPLPTDVRNVDESSTCSTGSIPEVPFYPTDQSSRKELFLIFTQALMGYLKAKRVTIHSRARDVIINCSEQKRNGNPVFAPPRVCMQRRLKQLVGKKHWKKSEELLKDYTTQQFMNNRPTFTFADARKKANAGVARSAVPPSHFYADVTKFKVPGLSILPKQQTRELGVGKVNTGSAPKRTRFVSFKEDEAI